MDKQLKTKGIILRRLDLGEADQIVTVLTEDQGKIALLAKGSRRLKSKFLGKLELFYEVELDYFQGRELGHLNEVESRLLIHESKLDLKSRSLLFFMAEATTKLVADDQECAKVFHLLKDALVDFEKKTSEPIFYAYLIKLLSELGFMSDWSHCTETDAKLDLTKTYYLSGHEAHLTTNPHLSLSGITLNPILIKWINYMQKGTFDQITNIKSTAADRNEVFFILKSILNTILPHPFKSEAFLTQID